MDEEFWLKILAGVLTSLIIAIIFGIVNLVKKFNKIDRDNTIINTKLERIFTVNDAQLQALNAIMLYIKYDIKNGELDEAEEKLREVTYNNKK